VKDYGNAIGVVLYTF